MISGARGILSMVCEFQVSGLIILHRNRFPIFGQGRYGVPYRGFEGFFGRMWAHMHGRFNGRHAYVHTYSLHRRAYMCTCSFNRRARKRACSLHRRALERACPSYSRALVRDCPPHRRASRERLKFLPTRTNARQFCRQARTYARLPLNRPCMWAHILPKNPSKPLYAPLYLPCPQIGNLFLCKMFSPLT